MGKLKKKEKVNKTSDLETLQQGVVVKSCLPLPLRSWSQRACSEPPSWVSVATGTRRGAGSGVAAVAAFPS